MATGALIQSKLKSWSQLQGRWGQGNFPSLDSAFSPSSMRAVTLGENQKPPSAQRRSKGELSFLQPQNQPLPNLHHVVGHGRCMKPQGENHSETLLPPQAGVWVRWLLRANSKPKQRSLPTWLTGKEYRSRGRIQAAQSYPLKAINSGFFAVPGNWRRYKLLGSSASRDAPGTRATGA
jgi:hypothetical protein